MTSRDQQQGRLRAMPTPPGTDDGTAASPPAAPRGRLALARAAIAWERLWPAVWPACGVVGLFLAAAWIGLPSLLNPWLHLVLLLATAGLAGWLAWRGLRGVRLPSREEARRRLERDSHFRHRPLATLDDRLGDGERDPVTLALWQAAQARARGQVDRVTLRAPHPNLAAHDPWALRSAVVLLLVVGATVSWGQLGDRLGQALRPAVGVGTLVQPSQMEVWVSPPDYTGLPPIFLTRAPAAGEDEGARAIPVPDGSTVLARLTGGYGTPELAAGGEKAAFEPVAGGGWQASREVTSGDRITISQGGRELRSWPIIVVPDQAPGIAFRQPPSATERQAVRLDYTAADDYGLERVTATVRIGVGLPDGVDQTPITLPLPLPGRSPREANGSGFHDLTPHPWAGLPVLIRLEAVDARGQVGSSADQPFLLPERRFSHPVARALIEQRRNLTLGGDRAREPVARAVAELSARPGAYGDRLSVFLALRTSVGRLMLEESPQAIADVQQTLWDTALVIEDGGLSLAERDLRDAQQRLMEALDNNAPDAEIEQLMAELEQAMQNFLDALDQQMREAMQNNQPMPEMQMPSDMEMVTREDLERMMQQMRDMAQTGSRDAARQMLSQLQQMMESLRTGEPPSPQQAQQQQQMMEMMQQLQELSRQQQELMDETFRQSQQGQSGQQDGQEQPGGMEFGQQGPQGPARQGRQPQQGQQGQQGQQRGQGQGSGTEMADRQEALRRQLGEIMRQLGEAQGDIPRQLGRAERSMNDAAQSLQQGAPGQAVPNQSQAVDQLQQGLQSMAEQLAQQMMQQGGMQAGNRPQNGRNRGRDPLGRPLPGSNPFNSEDVRIPEEADVQRAREILDELRRRSGDQTRPRMERDYIDRLLDRF